MNTASNAVTASDDDTPIDRHIPKVSPTRNRTNGTKMALIALCLVAVALILDEENEGRKMLAPAAAAIAMGAGPVSTPFAPGQLRNAAYMTRGHANLAPSRVEDDGRFTFFQFKTNAELPLVYKRMPDGRERLSDFHIVPETGTMVVHDVAANFVIRLGKSVMEIRNDGMRTHNITNPVGTTVPGAVRVIKESL